MWKFSGKPVSDSPLSKELDGQSEPQEQQKRI